MARLPLPTRGLSYSVMTIGFRVDSGFFAGNPAMIRWARLFVL